MAPKLNRFSRGLSSGLALYREQRRPESLKAFTEALEIYPEDGAAQRNLKLVQSQIETPPGPEWEAVTVMDGK